MTDKELEGIARQALNMSITARAIENYGGAILANYFDGEGLRRMRKVEQLLEKVLGEGWLGSGEAKDAAFGVLREATALFPLRPDALVFVTATNMFKPTAKFDALDEKRQREMLDGGHEAHHRLAAEGYFEIIDSVTAIAQTPERVCIASQQVDHGALVGQPETRTGPQEDFGGRLKMFGEDKLEKKRKAGAQ